MRVRIQIAAILLYVFSVASAASSWQAVFGNHVGSSAHALGAAQVLIAQSTLLRGTRGVLLQAHATFVDEDGKPVDVATLSLEYRTLETGDAVICVVRAPSTHCHALPLSDELNWRLANWVGLGGRRAFTLLSEDVPEVASLERAVQADGLVPAAGGETGEYVASVLNTPSILELLRHIDYSSTFPSSSNDDELVGKTNARFGHSDAPDEDAWWDATDGSYLNTDLDAGFSMKLAATGSLSGVPARYYWFTFKDKEYAYLESIRHARSIEDFRRATAAEQEWLRSKMVRLKSKLADLNEGSEGEGSSDIDVSFERWLHQGALDEAEQGLSDIPSEKLHTDAVGMFRTVAVLRTFAFGNPEAFMKCMEQISRKHTFVLQ